MVPGGTVCVGWGAEDGGDAESDGEENLRMMDLIWTWKSIGDLCANDKTIMRSSRFE
jgi:hypothetical protein